MHTGSNYSHLSINYIMYVFILIYRFENVYEANARIGGGPFQDLIN